MDSPSTNPAPREVRVAAERVLATSFDNFRLDAGATLSSSDRSAGYRFRTEDGPAQMPGSVIVKKALATGRESSGSGEPSSVERLLSEWSALQLLGEVAPGLQLAPGFYGGDHDAAIIVMEDLGPLGEGLTERLLGSDPDAARTDLVAYATTVGRLHARTVGHSARYHQIRNALGPPGPGLGHDWLARTFHAMLDAVDLAAPAELDDDLAVLEASIASPGPFTALIHGDPCPGNWVRAGSTDRFFDFEFSRIGHALLDGVYGRAAFPTCWCVGRLPRDVIDAMERAYRYEFAKGCPAARDDALYLRGMAEACAFWLAFTSRIFPLKTLLEEDPEWGTGTIRQRLLARLDVVIQATHEAGHLNVLGEVAAALARELHDRWDGEVAPLPMYPAFRSSSPSTL